MKNRFVITLDESFRPEWYAPQFQPQTNFCVSALIFPERRRADVSDAAAKIRATLGGVQEIKAWNIPVAQWDQVSGECLELIRRSGAKVFSSYYTQEGLVWYAARNERMGEDLREEDLTAARAEVLAWTPEDRKRELVSHVYRNAIQCLFHATIHDTKKWPLSLEFDRVAPEFEVQIRALVSEGHDFFEKANDVKRRTPVVTFHDSKDNPGVQLADLMSGKIRRLCYSNPEGVKRFEFKKSLRPYRAFHPRTLDASVAGVFSGIRPVLFDGMITLFLDDGVGRHLRLNENIEMLQPD